MASLLVLKGGSQGQRIQLDGDKFDKCLDSAEQAAAVDRDLSQGKGLGITGTPTTYVNGYTVNGAVSFDTLRELIQGQIDATQDKKAASDAPANRQASVK